MENLVLKDNDGYQYPAITTERKTGAEHFINGNTSACLLDFWTWAYSDLIGNTERGKLAEYIVSLAMGCSDDISGGWTSYDILSPEGIKIEVKTSGYLQSWAQKKLSDIRFGIRETLAWDATKNTLAKTATRQADTYVFCIENCEEKAILNPLDLSQWDFYVISSKTLNTKVSKQKSIGLNMLKNIGAQKCSFSELRDTVINSAKKSYYSEG